jgi:hypothetical protein
VDSIHQGLPFHKFPRAKMNVETAQVLGRTLGRPRAKTLVFSERGRAGQEGDLTRAGCCGVFDLVRVNSQEFIKRARSGKRGFADHRTPYHGGKPEWPPPFPFQQGQPGNEKTWSNKGSNGLIRPSYILFHPSPPADFVSIRVWRIVSGRNGHDCVLFRRSNMILRISRKPFRYRFAFFRTGMLGTDRTTAVVIGKEGSF